MIREIYEFQSRNGEKEQDSCPITYDYYQNGMLRTKRYDCLQYNEFHYDSYGHFMDCDTGAIDPEGVFIGTDPSKVSREYDKQGNLIRFQLDDEVDPVIREYQYDEQNRISKVSEKKEHQVSFTSGIVNVIQTEIEFLYREDGSYCVLVTSRQNEDFEKKIVLEYNKRGFPTGAISHEGHQQDTYESSFEYDEYWNLKRMDYRSSDYFHTVEYEYDIDNGKVVCCEVTDSSSIDKPVVYSVGYGYNEDGMLVRKGFGMNGMMEWHEYTYVYEDGETPSFLPEDIQPFAPLFPLG